MELFSLVCRQSPILVHVPHAGILTPKPVDPSRLNDPAAFRCTMWGVRDLYADTLGFDLADCLDATLMVNHVSRVWCDPERYPDDREEMNRTGMGVIYTHGMDGRPLYKPGCEPDEAERAERLALAYTPWHRMLADQCMRIADRHGRCLLVDMHSYPRCPHAGELHADEPRPLVDVGHNGDAAAARLAAHVTRALNRKGIGTAVNACYKGAMSVPDPRVVSLMLEVRRDAPIGRLKALLPDLIGEEWL